MPLTFEQLEGARSRYPYNSHGLKKRADHGCRRTQLATYTKSETATNVSPIPRTHPTIVKPMNRCRGVSLLPNRPPRYARPIETGIEE